MIQLQFLNYLLLKRDPTLITLNNLTDEFFSDYKDEFNFIKNHLQAYGNIPDQITFLNVFPDFDIIEVNETEKYLLDALYDDRNKRILAKTFNKVREALNNGNTEEAMRIYNSSSEKLLQAKHLEAIDIYKDLSRYDEYVERSTDFNKYYVKTGFPELDEIIGGWDRKEELATIVARPGIGKCLAKGTKIIMADGTLKKIEDVKVGDKVQSINGVNTVLALHNGVSKGYKITPNIGEDSFIVSENHILTLIEDETIKHKHTYKMIDISIEDFLNTPRKKSNNYYLYRAPIEYTKKELKIPPYILGLWLGDGTSQRAALVNKDKILIDIWEEFGNSQGLTMIKSKDRVNNLTGLPEKAYMYALSNLKNRLDNSVNRNLKYYNLIKNKHIPLDYLTSSREQRLELLAGILDTDGNLDFKGRTFTIEMSKEHLIDEITQLARGLGFSVGKKIVNQPKAKFNAPNLSYKINISGDTYLIPTKLPHKKAKSDKKLKNKNPKYTSFKVEEVPEIEYYGFMADGDHRYLLWNNIVTHNTWILLKTALEAAKQGLRVGIYEGEVSIDKTGRRIDTLMSHIPNGSINHGDLSIQLDYKKFLENIQQSMVDKIYVLTPDKIGGPASVNALRSFIEKYHLDMLCIDQHSLLEDDRKAKNPVERASNISRDLKNLQVMTKIPIISVSQQNRENTDEKGVGTKNIAQSDRIGQDSTCVIALEKKENRLTLNIIKARDGGEGNKLTYIIDLNKGIFSYMPSEDDGLKGKDCEDIKNEFEDNSYEEEPF